MAADEPQGRTGARHHEARGAVSFEAREAGLVEVDDDGARDQIVAAGKVERSLAVLQGVFDGGGVVGLAVAGGTESMDVGHGASH